MFKSTVRALVNSLGYDIVRRTSSPRLTWLGLRGRDIRLVLDVGANVGQFALEAHRAFPRATLVCFEPIPDVAEALRANLARHAIAARVVEVALSDASGEAPFFVHVGHSPSSSLLPTTPHGEALYPQTGNQSELAVRVETLDATLDTVGESVGGETLLKLDVQGNELRVLRGAGRTLGRVDHVLCEVNVDPLYRGQPTFAEIHGHLTAAGFHYAGAMEQVYGPDGRLVYMDALFTRADMPAGRHR